MLRLMGLQSRLWFNFRGQELLLWLVSLLAKTCDLIHRFYSSYQRCSMGHSKALVPINYLEQGEVTQHQHNGTPGVWPRLCYAEGKK